MKTRSKITRLVERGRTNQISEEVVEVLLQSCKILLHVHVIARLVTGEDIYGLNKRKVRWENKV